MEKFSSDKEREAQRTAMEKYVRDVEGWFAGTQRGVMVHNVIGHAVREAATRVDATPAANRPAGIDPLKWRDYFVAEVVCMRAGAFVMNQRDKVAARLTSLRGGLVERYSKRSNPSGKT